MRPHSSDGRIVYFGAIKFCYLIEILRIRINHKGSNVDVFFSSTHKELNE